MEITLSVEASQCHGMDPACLYRSIRLCRLSSLPRPVVISMSDCFSTLSQVDFSRPLQSVTNNSWALSPFRYTAWFLLYLNWQAQSVTKVLHSPKQFPTYSGSSITYIPYRTAAHITGPYKSLQLFTRLHSRNVVKFPQPTSFRHGDPQDIFHKWGSLNSVL